jgi:hypothetical protein
MHSSYIAVAGINHLECSAWVITYPTSYTYIAHALVVLYTIGKKKILVVALLEVKIIFKYTPLQMLSQVGRTPRHILLAHLQASLDFNFSIFTPHLWSIPVLSSIAMVHCEWFRDPLDRACAG